ncbi:MAG: glycosyltransferase [Bacteroidota bacterium]
MIEQLLVLLLLISCCSYTIIHGFLWKGLTGLANLNSESPLPGISVIVAARNEEKNIGALLHSLSQLQYPADAFEVIIVNDRSTDGTESIIQEFLHHNNNFRLLTISTNTSNMPNKKNALRAAIEQSRFDILAFTDADCIVPPAWLQNISQQFSDTVGVVAGYSPYGTDNTSTFLRFEEYMNSLTAASAVGLNSAYMCTGRNFAYRKSVYHQVGGFEKIKHSISGDDDLFLQLVKAETSWKIRYMTSPESYVRTIPPDSFLQFVHQRTRHISASAFYPKIIQSMYGVIHLFHLLVLVGLFISPLTALIVLMVKFNIDGALCARGKTIFGEEFSIPQFTANELLLVLYSFLIGPLGFIRTFNWKGTDSQ